MAVLNAQERAQLAQELANVSFNRASGKLRRLDPQNRLAFFRNSQSPTTLHTCYELPSKGVRVTLIEEMTEKADKQPGRFKPEFKLTQVAVEALA
ncbi:MAG: hypothetical protein SF162_10965 [bacterium]|nr:hypothetical protein [bacterium]